MTRSMSKFGRRILTSSILWWKAGTQVLARDGLRVSIDTELVTREVQNLNFLNILGASNLIEWELPIFRSLFLIMCRFFVFTVLWEN